MSDTEAGQAQQKWQTPELDKLVLGLGQVGFAGGEGFDGELSSSSGAK